LISCWELGCFDDDVNECDNAFSLTTARRASKNLLKKWKQLKIRTQHEIILIVFKKKKIMEQINYLKKHNNKNLNLVSDTSDH